MIDRARRDNLTVRQLAQIAGGYGGLSMVGTASTIADQMEEWLFTDACDGFNVMFPYVPADWTISSIWSFRNCSGVACSAPNTRVAPCGRISGLPGRRTSSFRIAEIGPHRLGRRTPTNCRTTLNTLRAA